MKAYFYTILTTLLLFVSVFSNAQTSLNLGSVWAYASDTCPPPVNVNLGFWGVPSTTGYNDITDNVTIGIYWGDGSNTTFTADLIDGGGTLDYVDSLDLMGHTHTYFLPGTYTQMVIMTGPDGNADTVYSSPLTITTGCALVDGYVYNDLNTNCIYDTGESQLVGYYITVKDASGNIIDVAYSDATGYYRISLPLGLTGLSISTTSYSSCSTLIALSCPSTGAYSFSTTSGSVSFNFGFNFSAAPTEIDYRIYHTAICNVASPGSNGRISIAASLRECANTGASYPVTVTLTLDPAVSYAGMDYGPVPTTIVGNVLTWNTTLSHYTSYLTGFNLGVKIFTSTSAVIGSATNFNLSIAGLETDPYVLDNNSSIVLGIGGPWDPNNKEVLPTGAGSVGYVAPETEFLYTLNFQNTGTAPAINVYVMDTISSHLDMSTFQIVANSDPVTPLFTNGNIIRFDFPGINLPDSTSNEPLSHGWVKYRIKTKAGLPNGTEIRNTGHIYFDYNHAIVTNTTLNTIDIGLGVLENQMVIAQENTIYPNPASSLFTVVFKEPLTAVMSLIDASGRVVETILLENETKVDISTNNLESGFYAITIPGVELKQSRIQIIR